MKRIAKIVFCLVVLLSFSSFVNAACNNEELNEWATKVEPNFIEIKELNLDSSEYAYLLSITPLRDDITLKAYDGEGNSADGKMLQPSSKEKSIMAVGCYTNLDEETYRIEVYGGPKSACPNQLLKTLEYTVPQFNRFIKDRRCENSDEEVCKTFTNSTRDMTQEQFDEIMGTAGNNSNGGFSFKSILNGIIEYGLYIIIPLVIISVFYVIKISKYKKEERDR